MRDDDGRPLAQAQVVLVTSGRGTLTDLDGRFRLRPLPAGEHRVQVSLIGYAPEQREVTVGRGSTTVEVALRRTPLTLPGVQATATPSVRDSRAVAQATTQLSGRALERELSGTVAQSLRAQPGVAVRAMGPAATAPVLRGLTGDRILVLQDGHRTGDLAGSADDHGVTIDPLAAQRVEVVRGPATLLYGNNALGGVVNVISGDVPTSVPARAEWSVGAQTESAYPGGSASVRGGMPVGKSWALSFRAGARNTGDMRIPDDPVLGDRLGNTGFRNRNAALGAGFVGSRLVGGGALRLYDFAYGLPVPPGSDPVTLEGARAEWIGRAELTLPSAPLPSVRVEGTAQDYSHEELDARGGDLLQRFVLETRTASVLARQGRMGPFAEGAWGASGLLKRYSATGPSALTPAADSRALGAFGYQEIALGGAEEAPALQLGGRFDRYEVESHGSPKFGAGVSRLFRSASGSAGVRVPVGGGVSAAFSVASSFRAPTVEELFSGAPHAGTGSVEVGNPALRAERGRSAELVVRGRGTRWNGQLAAWQNSIDDFVHLAGRGDSLIGGVRLPVLEYSQAPATLRGVEGSVELAARSDLALGLMGDLVLAERDDGTPLSFMPAPRLGASARWDDGRFSLGGDLHHEFRQDRVGPADERPTEAHTVVRLTAGARIRWGGVLHSLMVRAENLTDELHREAASRIKEFAPGPGRNLAVLYRAYF